MRVKWDIEIGNVLKVPLPEVVFFQEGPGLRKWQWTESGMKVINVTNILGDSAGTVDVSNTDKYISMLEFEKTYRHFAVEKGDFVVASSGNTYGKVGKITSECLPLMMNTSVIRFHSLNRDRLDDAYLYSFLRSPSFKNQIEQYVTGGAQPNFGPSHLKKMYIVLPSLPVQKKIASILSAYDGLIENNQRRIAILEEMARKVYRKRFVQGKCKDWPRKTFGDFVKVQRGKVITEEMSNEGDVPVIAAGTSPAYFNDRANVCAPCVTISASGANAGYVWMHQEDIWASDCSYVSLRQTPWIYFVYQFLISRTESLRGMQKGAAQPHVHGSDVEKLPFFEPPREVLEDFAKRVDGFYSQIRVLCRINKSLAAARDALLPKLMRGGMTK